nr:Chain A, ARG-PHE-LEU-ARG-ARG-ILE-PHE-PHE-PHE-PHE [synthetic construct]
RFLRRIFFFF